MITLHGMLTHPWSSNVLVKSKLKHPPPPRATPRHLKFWKIFVQIPHSRGQKAVQNNCPIIGPFQVIKCPQPPEHFSVASIELRKLCI